ncbi:MAG: aspartate-semialdehyde dehydrogenase [Candidatus Heimdallarchaeota archaeon]|nr:aspartate-semialdehyde dehydrogenase [Candidatus Heimdallarchaeota archaeon]
MVKKLRTAILGATGIVGQQFIRLLANHPYFEVVAVTASEKSVGKRYDSTVDWFFREEIPEFAKEKIICETDPHSLLKRDVELVFSALPSIIAKRIEPLLAEEGLYVFSNASANRMEENVPILIPEINASHLNLVKTQQFNEGFIVTNSNCCTSGFVFGIKPLLSFKVKTAFVTTYQAVSGAGRHGVSSLDILGNVIPFVPNEEKKIEQETKKILGKYQQNQIKWADFYINASCARVPVKNGHLESIVLELEEELSLEKVENIFNNFSGEISQYNLPTAPKKPIIVSTEKDQPQPARVRHTTQQNEGEGMNISIGRIRKKGSFLNFFLLVDNLVRGAAGASILNAEFAKAKNFLR